MLVLYSLQQKISLRIDLYIHLTAFKYKSELRRNFQIRFICPGP